MSLVIVAYGRPAPQGSKKHVGNGIMVESSKAVKPWREDVKAAAEKAIGCPCGDDCGTVQAGYPLDGPLIVRMVFTVTRPRSHYRTGRNAHLLRDGASLRPSGTPDLSKLIRSTEDALTTAGAWRDDARVVEYERAAKVYAGEDPEALDVPGVRITVRVLAAHPVRESIADALENDRCGICGSVEHFREDCPEDPATGGAGLDRRPSQPGQPTAGVA